MDTTNTTVNSKVKVLGKVWTVLKVGKHGVDLVGPRGGAGILVQNIHTGRWVLIEGNSIRPRVHAVGSWEVL